MFAISLFLVFIIFCLYFNRSLDGYFMWMCLFRDDLTVYWCRKPIYMIKLPFSLKYPLWIPLAPVIIMLTYFIATKRLINSKIILYGRRIHHYHVGILSIGIAAMLLTILIIILNSCVEPTVIQLGWKKTNVVEILQGLALLFIIGGIALILLDLKDICRSLKFNFARLRGKNEG